MRGGCVCVTSPKELGVCEQDDVSVTVVQE